ncbi:MAG: bifunctional alpha/beta hydrolase/class I SAM-dependent methyltransferase [Gemmataceae bacterium]
MGPRLSEHTLEMPDGATLLYRAWMPPRGAEKALVLFHRGHEHSGRWQETVESLALDDVAVFAWDARGHGGSSGERGSAPDLATVVKDADIFIHHLSETYGISLEDMIVLGHSVGAVIAAAWVHDYAPPVRGMILATPAFRVRLYVPFAVPLLRLRQRLFGPGYVKSYVKASMLTHDSEQAQLYKSDHLIFRQIAVNVLLDLHDASKRLLADTAAIKVPAMVLAASSDWVVKQSAQKEFFDNLSSPGKSMEVLPGFHHAIFHEKNRARVVDKVRAFLVERFREPVVKTSLVDADKCGYTKAEYERLRGRGSWVYAIPRLVLKTVGRLSNGIRLGWRTGFDSGMTLDYVYGNKPQGFTLLGRLIDRAFLQSIGWKGIRQRKAHLAKALRSVIETVHDSGRPVRLLDIASGPGRYLLETMDRLKHIPMTALLRDYKQENLKAARSLVNELGLDNVTVDQGDAFDQASLVDLAPRPSIAIVSGLYELFHENNMVLRSLRSLAETVEPGGYLLYTNQPWHPQLEFIARVLRNREGKPWVMRRRTQAEMDELVCMAGFEKVSQDIDPWGLFTVSVAQRISA